MKKVLFLAAIITVLAFAVTMAIAADLKVIVEAESFTKEEGGSVEKISGRVAASNSCLLGWNNQGHALEWEVNIPEDAEYKVVLRYANGRKWTVYRDLQIDGAYPGDAFKKITLPATGGFSKTSNDWKNLTVSDSQGQAALFKLTAGKHIVRMNNLGGDKDDGATNLDSFGFLGKDVDASVLGK